MDCFFSERTVMMTPGSRLVLYSDGLTEAMNLSDEQFGEERLREHLVDRSSSVDSLLDDVERFSGTNAASDDRTVVMIDVEE
jgi:sigma-B regulation protein RsbU (phosphoserine phosphatase)